MALGTSIALGPKTASYKEAIEARTDNPLTESKDGAVASPLDISKLRRDAGAFFGALLRAAPKPDGVSIEVGSISISGINVNLRIYKPVSLKGDLVPAIIYHTAGGLSVDMQEGQDAACMLMALSAGAMVISIQPPLAPEFKHPEILNFAYLATRHLFVEAERYQIDRAKFYLSGYSMGGNLAALIALRAKRARDIDFAAIILISAQTDLSLSCRDNPKYNKGADLDFMAPKSMQELFINLCLPDGVDKRNPEFSPFFDDLRGLPHLVLIGGSCDALMPDMRAMADKCEETGCPYTLIELSGLIHNANFIFYLMADGEHPSITAGREVAKLLARDHTAAKVATVVYDGGEGKKKGHEVEGVDHDA